MRVKKIAIYASLATLLLSGTKLTVEACPLVALETNFKTNNDKVNDYINHPEKYETLTVNDVTFEKMNEYAKRGYILVSRSATSAFFIREKANVIKKRVTNVTEEELIKMANEGYKLVAGNEDEFENKVYYFEKVDTSLNSSNDVLNYTVTDYINHRNEYETLVIDKINSLELEKYANKGFMPLESNENVTLLIRKERDYEQDMIINPSNEEIIELQKEYDIVAGNVDEYGNITYVYEKKIIKK